MRRGSRLAVLLALLLAASCAGTSYWDGDGSDRSLYRSGTEPEISRAAHDEFAECGLSDDDMHELIRGFVNTGSNVIVRASTEGPAVAMTVEQELETGVYEVSCEVL